MQLIERRVDFGCTVQSVNSLWWQRRGSRQPETGAASGSSSPQRETVSSHLMLLFIASEPAPVARVLQEGCTSQSSPHCHQMETRYLNIWSSGSGCQTKRSWISVVFGYWDTWTVTCPCWVSCFICQWDKCIKYNLSTKRSAALLSSV